MRDRIKSFAREKVDLPVGRHKIVILDEVDSMTEAAQQARMISLVCCYVYSCQHVRL